MSLLKTRFAPSPSGQLHFGSVRTALFNALLAQKTGGMFSLRIEDTDTERSKPEFVEGIQNDLAWLGLNWQEGPVHQSQRTEIYQAYAQQLEADDLLYPCFCTPLELEVSRKVQASAGKPPRYDGKCARLTLEERNSKLDIGFSSALRFRMPPTGEISFTDIVRGVQKFPCSDIGDFIVRRSDGSYAFFFVNAVDDALMGITHVLRGEDHLTNTPRQIALLQALALPIPQYGHISLIVDALGAPLSKRSGSLAVQTLREQGYFPLAVINYLARLGHVYAENDLLGMRSLASAFDLQHLGRSPAHYDHRQLLHWQALAVQQADAQILEDWVKPVVADIVPPAELGSFLAAIRDNIMFPEDARLWATAIYSDPLEVADDAKKILQETPEDFFKAALGLFQNPQDFAGFTEGLKTSLGLQGKKLFQPLRAALTGQLHGPEMPRIFPLIGKQRIRDRLQARLK